MTKKPALLAACIALTALATVLGRPSDPDVVSRTVPEGAPQATDDATEPDDGATTNTGYPAHGTHAHHHPTAEPSTEASSTEPPSGSTPDPHNHHPTASGPQPSEPPEDDEPEDDSVGPTAGQFRVACRFSHQAPDDPIVHPHQPGASHQHDFFGNTSTNAHSTYATMRAADTTCNRDGDTAAYWAPSLYVDGTWVRPRNLAVYYTTGGKDRRSIVAPPRDLRVIADEPRARWGCHRGAAGRRTVDEPHCKPDEELRLDIRFPDCWDGLRHDSMDHRSHMAYPSRGQCPDTHPVPVPSIRLSLRYPTTGGHVTLGSPRHSHSHPPHADFWNTWDQAELERLVRGCLNKGVRCGNAEPPQS